MPETSIEESEEKRVVPSGLCRALKIGQGIHINRENDSLDITIARLFGIGLERTVELDVQGGETPGKYQLSLSRPDAEVAKDIHVGYIKTRPKGKRAYLSFKVRRSDMYVFY